MDKIIEKTKELGELIKENDRTKRLALADLAVNGDLGLQYMIREFNEKRNKMLEMMGKGEENKAVIDPLNDEIKKLYDEIMENNTMKEYNAAKAGMDELLGEVNSIINFYVTGEEQSGCSSGGCSSCSGCH